MGLFNIDDGIDFGATAGFVEESIKEEIAGENDQNKEISDEFIEDCIEDSTNTNLKLLYNDNPSLAIHIMKKFKESQQNGNPKIKQMETENLFKEMEEEIEHLAELEDIE